MNLLDTMRQRRSIRHFDSEHRFTDAELKNLLTAGALAPSSFNMQNRHFVCVVDQDVKTRLCAASWKQEHVRDASAVFVLTGNRNAYKNTERYLRDAPDGPREVFEQMIPVSYAENDALARDEDCRSVAFAGMNMMLMAKDMGYESCPLIGFDPQQVSEILGLPADHEPLLIIVAGKGTSPAWDRLGLLDFEELVSMDQFGQNTITGPVEG